MWFKELAQNFISLFAVLLPYANLTNKIKNKINNRINKQKISDTVMNINQRRLGWTRSQKYKQCHLQDSLYYRTLADIVINIFHSYLKHYLSHAFTNENKTRKLALVPTEVQSKPIHYSYNGRILKTHGDVMIIMALFICKDAVLETRLDIIRPGRSTVHLGVAKALFVKGPKHHFFTWKVKGTSTFT